MAIVEVSTHAPVSVQSWRQIPPGIFHRWLPLSRHIASPNVLHRLLLSRKSRITFPMGTGRPSQVRASALYCTNSVIFATPLEANMGTVRKTITLTDKQDEWIKAQIASGDFTNDSEYIRDLVRRDQEQNAKFQALKQAVQEGLDSGESDKTITDIMEEVEARLRADGRL